MVKIKKLNNGLKIITAPLTGTKTVTALTIVATGSRFENKNNSGISHFLEHMFFKGTKRRPTTLAISSELDRVGGEFNAFTGKEYTGYYVKVAADKLKLALDVLSDMLLNSLFSAQEIEREKGVVAEELNMYLDNPLIHIEDLFEESLYGDTPAGRDTVGTKTTIANFSRPSLLKYYNQQYSANQTIVCLAGKVTPADAGLAAKYFSALPRRPYRDKPKTDDRQSSSRLKLRYKKTDQAHLSLGTRALPYAQPDQAVIKILAALLGGSMSSRLFIELRERRGLAYYVKTHEEAYTDSGYLTTQAGVPTDKLAEAVKIILKEYNRLTREPVGAEELIRAKESLIGRGALQLEASDAIASWYARQIIMFKEQKRASPPLKPEEYYTRLRKVTAADVQRLAKRIFKKEKLNLAVIGPYRDEGKLKKLLKF